MHALHKLLLGATAFALPAVTNAATIIPVTPPEGAVAAIVFGINQRNVIAGSFFDSAGVEHGFTGPLNGSYTTFDFGGTSVATEPRGLNDSGDIVGFAADPAFAIGTEFLRTAGGALSAIEKDGLPLDGIAQGIIKKKATSTGDYIDPNDGVRKGYLAKNGAYQSDVDLDLADVIQTSPRGMNKHGTLAGFYFDTTGLRHGFILKNNVAQTVDADGTGTSALEAINKKELATGQVVGSDGNPHSFLYDNTNGTFTSIDIPDGSVLQQAWGLNDKGVAAVSTDIATYIYCTRKVHCPDGGTAIADGRSWKMKPGASLLHNGNGRNGVKPPKLSARAARQ